MNEPVTLEVVAAREARWANGRARQRLLTVVSAAVVVATVAALATNGALGDTGTGLDAPIAADGGTALPDAGAGTGAPPVDLGSEPPFTIVPEESASGADLPVLTVPSAPAGAPVASGSDGPPTVEAVGPDGETVIVHPVLQFLAFGGQIGMPLVCTLVASTVGQAITDPAVTAVVGQIQSTCVTGANQGADALRALDAQLAALAAVNSAVQPVLDGLADALSAASTADAPFASYLLQIVALVRFLQGQ